MITFLTGEWQKAAINRTAACSIRLIYYTQIAKLGPENRQFHRLTPVGRPCRLMVAWASRPEPMPGDDRPGPTPEVPPGATNYG
jgi:hypothetical protein